MTVDQYNKEQSINKDNLHYQSNKDNQPPTDDQSIKDNQPIVDDQSIKEPLIDNQPTTDDQSIKDNQPTTYDKDSQSITDDQNKDIQRIVDDKDNQSITDDQNKDNLQVQAIKDNQPIVDDQSGKDNQRTKDYHSNKKNQPTKVKLQKHRYDLAIKIDTLESIKSSGWKLIYSDSVLNEEPDNYISIIGSYQSGKSYILNKLESKAMEEQPLSSISLVKSNLAKDTYFINSPGENGPVPSGCDLVNACLLEKFIGHVVSLWSNNHIVVFNRLTYPDIASLDKMKLDNTVKRLIVLNYHHLYKDSDDFKQQLLSDLSILGAKQLDSLDIHNSFAKIVVLTREDQSDPTVNNEAFSIIRDWVQNGLSPYSRSVRKLSAINDFMSVAQETMKLYFEIQRNKKEVARPLRIVPDLWIWRETVLDYLEKQINIAYRLKLEESTKDGLIVKLANDDDDIEEVVLARAYFGCDMDLGLRYDVSQENNDIKISFETLSQISFECFRKSTILATTNKISQSHSSNYPKYISSLQNREHRRIYGELTMAIRLPEKFHCDKDLPTSKAPQLGLIQIEIKRTK
ncbi:hypothetical protein PPL_02658 [Heterostelium album PN500]|uniref:Uncharacterized protein n=1 Tax=Heterostelium pallidum (strain ATCC 26659 / Pp 5 / PN500) TaxID=670386 RepID=D3B2P4_HETP5|nr:hypothetical protein PPL_02658 [Heterostelium album PN500]EFA83592.1 hypothetical protein PPL_02658 [Heterostelium album PN500]|eukprot:XP_020435709.1 hypothetical protein PPL_02658 [Heterostelium album PN500]